MISALHHNKTKKNYHIHLIFSERRLLPEPDIKIATRSVFYDELGKRVRTKKEITGEDGMIREGCTVIKKGEVYERHLFTTKDDVFKNELFLEEVKQFYTALINRNIHDPERRLKVFDPNSVYLPTKKIGKNNPKAAEIEADNAARQDWNRTADMALVSGIAESKIIEIKNEHVYNEASRSVQKHGWLPGLFRGIIQKAKEILIGLIRETEIPPKPTLSIDMAEYRKMQKLMGKVQDEARAIKQLMHGELPNLEKKLAETTGLFKGKERKALQEKIAGVQQEIDHRMDRLSGILKEDGYPDVQAFKRLFDNATTLVEQYNHDLAAWEQEVNGKGKASPQQSKPPEKESIRKKLRDMEVEAKRRNDARRQQTRSCSHDYDRGR
ncbi:MAG: MobA/MobL family protein [Erysipelotrichaceae bacterium]|nr:MobA/MobL family protein [Erysipelotrichaceae bacterium]